MKKFKVELDGEVEGFLAEMESIHRGNTSKAIAEIIVEHPAFFEWRERVLQCRSCKRWIPRLRAPGRLLVGPHRIKNTDAAFPVFIECKGSYKSQYISESPRREKESVYKRIGLLIARMKTIVPDILTE